MSISAVIKFLVHNSRVLTPHAMQARQF